MPKASTYFDVSGLEPIHDPTWYTAGPAQRAAYLRVCRVLVLTEWDRQTAAGLDKDGAPLRPIRQSTRERRRSAMGPADPNAPPLQPAHELSRTRSLIDARIVGLTVRVFWKFDPVSGRRWGAILNYHRLGAGHLPVRDVFGISPEARQRVLQAAYLWWAGYSRGLPVVFPVRPRPGQASRPPAAKLPEYRRKEEWPHTATTTPAPVKSRAANVSIGGDIYTMSRSSAAELLSAIKGGQFTGFRSYQ